MQEPQWTLDVPRPNGGGILLLTAHAGGRVLQGPTTSPVSLARCIQKPQVTARRSSGEPQARLTERKIVYRVNLPLWAAESVCADRSAHRANEPHPIAGRPQRVPGAAASRHVARGTDPSGGATKNRASSRRKPETD